MNDSEGSAEMMSWTYPFSRGPTRQGPNVPPGQRRAGRTGRSKCGGVSAARGLIAQHLIMGFWVPRAGAQNANVCSINCFETFGDGVGLHI